MHFVAFSILQICVWKQTFTSWKDESYKLTFDWHFGTLSQSEIRIHWWTHNSKNPTNLGRWELNLTLHQSSHGFATRVHGFATKKQSTRARNPASYAGYRGRRSRWITPSGICRILYILRKPNSINALLFILNISPFLKEFWHFALCFSAHPK